jgi:DNA-binding protein
MNENKPKQDFKERERDVVFVGRKDGTIYIEAFERIMRDGYKEIKIKSRLRNIEKAASVAFQILKRAADSENWNATCAGSLWLENYFDRNNNEREGKEIMFTINITNGNVKVTKAKTTPKKKTES